jgi:hypothetical protein
MKIEGDRREPTPAAMPLKLSDDSKRPCAATEISSYIAANSW